MEKYIYVMKNVMASRFYVLKNVDTPVFGL